MNANYLICKIYLERIWCIAFGRVNNSSKRFGLIISWNFYIFIANVSEGCRIKIDSK